MESQSEENQDAVISEQDLSSYSLLSNKANFSTMAKANVNDTWTWPTYSFWTQYGDLGNPANPVVRIGPGFTSWSFSGLGMPGEEKVYRNTTMRALQNAFGATNGRINGNLEWINQLWDWETTGRARVNNLWSWSSGVDQKNIAQDNRLTASETWQTNNSKTISSLWDWSITVDAKNTSQDNRLTASETWQTNNSKTITSLWDWSIVTQKWIEDYSKTISSLWDWSLVADDQIKVNSGKIGSIETAQSNMSKSVSSLWDWSLTADDRIKTNSGKIGSMETAQSNMSKSVSSLWDWSNDADDQITTNSGKIGSMETAQSNMSKSVSNLWDWSLTADDQIKTNSGNIGSLEVSQSNMSKAVSSLWDWSYTTDSRLSSIESFDFGSVIDLTILVTAINAVGSKVQDLINVFNVTDPQPDSFAFFFQSHIKSQTLAIVDALAMVDESLNDNFVNYFSDSKNGQFWTAYKEFSDFQMAVFFGVFFESLQEDWESNWLTVLDVWNTTNSFLATIAGWLDQIQLGVADSKEILSIITNWLKLIYEKPVPSFNVPVFDYLRLERMLEKLEFGEVVNEAGTNIWDFLTGLVDTLGDLIETQLKEFTKVLSEILDFLDGLIDKMIGLIVPENLDFMRQGFDDVNLKFKAKFGNFLNISASITQMFQPIEKDFIGELSFDFMGVPFVPDVTILGTFVPKFRNVVALLMWFNVGWWAFRRFTGTGDVVNDN